MVDVLRIAEKVCEDTPDTHMAMVIAVIIPVLLILEKPQLVMLIDVEVRYTIET